ncbi:VanZ family protein [Brachybacterium sp. GPGPB12]|uniref:VanZ family protein n=1 Tax=Brachybacterium sp. GPGPB12 TaxID=3023517 RepID=UPI0031342526
MSPGGIGLPGLDKAVHLLLFAATVFTAGRVLAPARRFPIGWVVVAALVHALVVELVQHAAIPGRSGDPLDVLFDVVGIALGLGLWAGERIAAPRRRRARGGAVGPAARGARSAEGPWIPAAPACGGVSRSA